MRLLLGILLAVVVAAVTAAPAPQMLSGFVAEVNGYTGTGELSYSARVWVLTNTFHLRALCCSAIKTSGNSTLYRIDLPTAKNPGEFYSEPPYVVSLKGTRRQIGFDYAALLNAEASYSYEV